MPNILRFYETNVETNEYLVTHRDLSSCLLIKGASLHEISEKDAVPYKKGSFVNSHGCLGILPVNVAINGESKIVELLLLISHCESVGKLRDSEIFRITDLDVRIINIPGILRVDQVPALKQTWQSTRNFFSNGKSYFCVNRPNALYTTAIHLSQQQQNASSGKAKASSFYKFVWNRGMFHRFNQFNVSEDWTFKIICGGVSVRSINVQGDYAQTCLLYRQSCERAGTRFLTRGVDENGHVANFVESEIIISCNEKLTSYVITRGSIPLFWDQPGIQVGAHKTRFTRELTFSSCAFLKHMHYMKTQYGRFAIIDLLGINRGSEDILSKAYESQLKLFSSTSSIPYLHFDFHAECPATDQERRRSGLQRLHNLIQNTIPGGASGFGFFYSDDSGLPTSTRLQIGVFRVNCLDCLDRTNMVQGFIAERVLPSMLAALFGSSVQAALDKFLLQLPDMVKLCGDEVSKMYAGTGALSADDRTGKFFDAGKSAARTFQNNFFDEAKQQSFDLVRNTLFSEHPIYQKSRMLCNDVDLNIPFKLREHICDNQLTFSFMEQLRVCVGTWNVNGGKQFQKDETKDETDISLWLFHAPEESLKQFPPVNGYVAEGADFNMLPDIYAVGFEEIVDLDLKNIVSTSHITADQWHEKLSQLFCPKGYSSLLRGCQLVGVSLFVFVKNHHVPHVKSIASQSLKTGLKGTTGNKGGVAIRFQLYSTSMCFVCSHFAAGQSNYSERNADFHSLASRFKFPPLNVSLNDHDYIFWCGDFNYRIDMENALTRNYIEMCQWPKLLENDQLTLQRSEGNVFDGYLEGPVMFAPTYKYDLLTDDYDSSEKCRTPAWTDRILWKRRPAFFYLPPEYWPKDLDWSSGDLVYYGRAEVKSSDHRPVVAYMDIDVQRVDSEKRKEAISNLLAEIGPPNGAIFVKLVNLQSQSWVQMTTDWRLHLEQYLSEYTEGGFVCFSRVVASDMLHMVFRDGAHAVKAVALSGHRMTTTVELRVEYATPNFVDSYLPEMSRLEEKTKVDFEVAFEVQQILPKEDAVLKVGSIPNAPLISFSSVDHDQSQQNHLSSVAKVKEAPPRRPPPPKKISNSHSTGNLCQERNVGKSHTGSFVEQTPLLGVSDHLSTKAVSSVDVTDTKGNVEINNKKQFTTGYQRGASLFAPSASEIELNSNASSATGSRENVALSIPAPPSNCNSYFDLTDPPVAAKATAKLQPAVVEPNSSAFDSDFSQMSLANKQQPDNISLGIAEGALFTKPVSNGKIPPPLPPKSERHRRPVPPLVPK